MSSNTVRFVGEFDDTKITQGLNNVKASLSSLSSMQVPSLFSGMEAEMAHLEQTTNALGQGVNGLGQEFDTLDSASTGLSGTFEEIGNAANQAGQNFDALGTSGQTAQQQLADIGTTSVTAGQSMTALGGSATTVDTNFGALNTTLGTAQGGLTEFNTLSGTTTSTMGDMGDSAETTGSKFEKVFSKGGSIAVGISATISGIANLVRGFRDYSDSQIRVEKATIAVSKAQEAVRAAQEKYNAAVAEGGKNSADAQKALVDLGQAQDTLGVRQENLTIQTKRSADAQVNMWLGLAGTVTGIGGSIIQSLDAIGGEKGLTGLVSKAKSASLNLGGLSVSMLGLGSAIGIVVGGLVLANRLLQDDAKTMAAFAAEGIKLTKVQDDGNRAFAEMNRIMDVTHMNMLQIVEDPVKAAAAYKAMGGEVSANGEIVTKTADQWDAARSPLQILWETMFGGAKATNDASAAVKTMDTTINTHIPTVISLTSSTRGLYKEGQYLEETYVRGAKTLDMYNVEQQKNTTVINAAYEGFKQLYGGVTTTTTTIDAANKTVTASGDVYSQWINKGVDPANQIIKELSKSVQNGVIPQDQLGKAVELAADKMQAAGVVTEANKEQTILLATSHLKTKPAIDATAKALEDYKATMADAKRINDEYTKALADNEQKYIDIAKEGHEWDDTLAILNSVTGQHIVKTDADADALKGLAGALKTSRTEFKSQETAMGLVLDKHGLLTTAIEQEILDNNDDTEALKKLIIEQVNWADALTNTTTQIKNHNTGVEQAVEAMEKYINEAQIAAAKTEAMDKGYLKVGQSIAKDFVGGLKLTVPQLQELGKHLGTAEQQAQAFSDIVQAKMAPAMSKLSSAINATNIKDFNEAFNDIDFGKISGDMEDFARDVSFGFQQIADKQDQMENLFAVVTLGLEKMTQSQASEWMGKIEQKFNAIAKIDPSKFTGEVKNLVASFSDLSKADIDKHAQSIQYLIDNLSTWDSGKAEIFLGKWTDENLNPAATATDSLGNAIGTTGTNAATAAPKLDAVAAALTSVNLAAADVANKMSTLNFEFAPPKLDQVAQAFTDIGNAGQQTADKIAALQYNFPAPNTTAFINAVDTVVKRWQSAVKTIGGMKPALTANNTSAIQIMDAVVKRWQSAKSTIENIKPKITVDNSQAISAINKVISAMNQVKNKSVTITTTYKTVGSPAGHGAAVGGHGAAATAVTGVGGHGAGGETVAIPPMINNTVLAAPTAGGGGDLNITIVNRDEFGTEKIRKYKAAMGAGRYTFGTVGAGG